MAIAKYGDPYIQEHDRGSAAGQLKCSLVSGAGSATKISVSGMKAGDKIVGIFNLTDLTQVDRTTLVSVEDGGFKIAGSTSGKKVFVVWMSV